MTIKTLTQSDLPALVNLHYSVLPNEFLTSISKSFLLGFYQILFSSPHTRFLGVFTPATGDASRVPYGTVVNRNIYSGWQERRASRRVPAASFSERGHRTGRAPDRTRLDYNDASQNFGRLAESEDVSPHLIAAIVCLEKNFKPNLISYLLLFLKNLSSFLTSPKSLPRAKSRGLISLFQSFLFKLNQPQETEIFFIGVSPDFQGQGLGKKLVQILEKTLSPKYEALSVDCKCKLPSNNFYKSCGFKIKKTFRLYNEDWNRYEKNLK